MTKQNNKTWGIAQIWNSSLAGQEKKKYKERDHLWASELGKSPVDIWLKTRGVPPTNPPNARARRKFSAGNIWEWIGELILKRAGILKDTQEWLSHQYPDLVEVTGKLDFLAGGEPSYDIELEQIGLPDGFVEAGKNIVTHLKEEYPDGLETQIVEMKSCSSFMFDKNEKRGRAQKNHEMQLFHYLKAKGLNKGTVLYICKDDCRMAEYPVFNSPKFEKPYKEAIEILTKHIEKDERPPLEKPIVFEDGRFSKNWKVEYSNYLTKLYDFEKPKDFYEKYGPIAKSWNRVISRLQNKDKNITGNNLEKISEMKKAGFNIFELLEINKQERLKK